MLHDSVVTYGSCNHSQPHRYFVTSVIFLSIIASPCTHVITLCAVRVTGRLISEKQCVAANPYKRVSHRYTRFSDKVRSPLV